MFSRLVLSAVLFVVAPLASEAQQVGKDKTAPSSNGVTAVYWNDFGPNRRYAIKTERPEFADESRPGAAAFNRAMRAYIQQEAQAFRADVADLPANFEPELTIKARPYFPADGVISVRFDHSGVLGSGFVSAAVVTVNVATGRRLALSDLFSGDVWKATALKQCRAAAAPQAELIAAPRPELIETCDDPALYDVRSWWLGASAATIVLLAPGKELFEFKIPYAAFGAALRPDAPVGRRP